MFFPPCAVLQFNKVFFFVTLVVSLTDSGELDCKSWIVRFISPAIYLLMIHVGQLGNFPRLFWPGKKNWLIGWWLNFSNVSSERFPGCYAKLLRNFARGRLLSDGFFITNFLLEAAWMSLDFI